MLAAAGFASSPQQEPAPDQNPPPAVPLGSTSSFQGASVEEIEFPEFSAASDQKRLRTLVVQQVGQPLDRDRIRQSIQALYATGRFADIRAEAERPRMAQSSSTSSPLRTISWRLRVEGNPDRPSVSQVINASKLELESLFTRDHVDRALTDIKQLFEENGYYRTTVSETEMKHSDTQQIGIKFSIVAGPQAHIGEVSVWKRELFRISNSGNHAYAYG